MHALWGWVFRVWIYSARNLFCCFCGKLSGSSGSCSIKRNKYDSLIPRLRHHANSYYDLVAIVKIRLLFIAFNSRIVSVCGLLEEFKLTVGTTANCITYCKDGGNLYGVTIYHFVTQFTNLSRCYILIRQLHCCYKILMIWRRYSSWRETIAFLH